jgi:hypothetical protein
VIPVAHIETNSRPRLNHHPLPRMRNCSLRWHGVIHLPARTRIRMIAATPIIGIDDLFERGGWAIAQGDL